jgi:hypothetical protein
MTNQRTFATERLQLAIFLHADGRLSFRNCGRIGHSKVCFVFDDPKHIGDSLELEFENGAKVSATSLFASQKYLRRQMSVALENRRTREYARNP